jgi:Ca2+-binding EF-hand superfamily protein
MNVRKITVTLVTLTLLVMATSSFFNDTNELQPNGIVEFSHEGGVANGTAILGGILTWEDNAWNDTWDCDGGLALVSQTDWDDFVASGDNDPHNYTSWGIELTGADSYYTENAPEGEWVVTAGLSCTDGWGDSSSAGGQYGDVHENPPTVNLTNGTTVGAVDFTLIEHSGGDDGPLFICGNGDQIAFGKVNNGLQDCEDGADEQQYHESDVCLNTINGQEYTITDPGNASLECESFYVIHYNDSEGVAQEDCENGHTGQYYGWAGSECDATWFEVGDELNWFDCLDGSEVWIHQVNDGNDDCPDGEDEGNHDNGGDLSSEGMMEMIDSNDDGNLSLQEILDFSNEQWASNTGENMSQEDEDRIADGFAESDADGNGLLDFAEFESLVDWMNDDGDDGPTFVCGDGEEIPFDWVNDGDLDCTDGADEQQYYDTDTCWNIVAGEEYVITDEGNASLECESFILEPVYDENGTWYDDNCSNVHTGLSSNWDQSECEESYWFETGDKLNWFDCNDENGTDVWIDQVNDGIDDCPNGADESDYDERDDDLSYEEIMEMIDSNDDGNLSLQEILDFANEVEYNQTGQNMSQEEENQITNGFAESDADGNELLDLDELEFFFDLVNDDGGDGPTFICGNGYEIPFGWVNDGEEDCDDGSDEPQDFDDDGVTDNWFDCPDGTNISMDLVNDGNDDCPNGEDEGNHDNGGDDGNNGPDCLRLMHISFQQNADDTADLTFTNTCSFDSDASAEMSSYMDSDNNSILSPAEIAAVQDEMNADQTCHDDNGTEVPCVDDDEGIFSYDGVVMATQPMGDDSMMTLSVNDGIVSMSSTEVISVPSDSSLYSHTFGYDAGADWNGGSGECSGGVDVTATSPWNASSVTFSPASDWVSAMYADGSGWHVSNIDADEDGHCNSQPSVATMIFTTPVPEPEPEPVVDTAPTCEIYYNIGGVVLTANSNWSTQVQGAVSFEVPSDGEFTLALPVGEYSVILACNDAQGDAIVVSITDGIETWGGTAQDGMIYSEGLFNITDSDVNESVDITLTWSSTAFNGTFNTHFTAVESVTDALDVTDTGALPGFTSMISITAMLGAAMILARRKD